MNPLEFSSKTICLFSADKHERIDLSVLPDDVFDDLLHRWSKTNTCREGSPYTGYYIYDSSIYLPMITELEEQYGESFHRIRRFGSFLRGLKDGELFWCVSDNAPTLNKRLAILQANAQKNHPGEGQIRLIHDSYLFNMGSLSYGYTHFAYGFAGYKEMIGAVDKSLRKCRFCGRAAPEAFRKESHAISEGLGNKFLICNEECDECNGRLAKVENNLMRYFDVRRAMFGIKSKTSGTIPIIEGKGFVIRNRDDIPQLYIELESLPAGVNGQSPFFISNSRLMRRSHIREYTRRFARLSSTCFLRRSSLILSRLSDGLMASSLTQKLLIIMFPTTMMSSYSRRWKSS